MIKENNTKIIQQEDINNSLKIVAQNLKSITNIGSNYMEYTSALIYVTYEKGKEFRKMLEIRPYSSANIALFIDKCLNDIRIKEDSNRLFRNIKFSDVIDRESEPIFRETIYWLNSIITDLINICDAEVDAKSILAKAFEYIIMLAAQDNKISLKNGEFYTPKGVVKTMVKLLQLKDKTSIYNPACGIGNFFTESAKISEIYAFGEENNISNYNICITNLWLHDIYNKRIRGDSDEIFQQVDVAIANPPFVNENRGNIRKFELRDLPNASNYTKYLIKMLDGIHENGRMAIIVPHGFLFKTTNAEYTLRKKLVEKSYIDAIIGLPEKLFYNTKIPVAILLINKTKRTKGEILFIDASNDYTSKRKTNILTEENQDKILKTYLKYITIPNYSYIANMEEIRNNNYDLNIKRYVQIENKVEDINEAEVKKKLQKLEEEKKEIQRQIKEIIGNI